MSAFWLFSGGALGSVVAVVHAVLGQRLILRQVSGLSAVGKRVLLAVFHLSSLYWALAGLLMMWLALAAPKEHVRPLGIVVMVIYLSRAIGNFWATRGRHFGWVLLTVCGALVGAGVFGLTRG
ncbi:MAG: hypothetical protein AAGA68_10640 [Pseudomonadota bacterium]